jgi:hypothetical protein
MPDPSALLMTLPAPVRWRVEFAFRQIRAWNAALEQARRMEVMAHQPGRYEYDLRYGETETARRAELAQARRLLEVFETLAQTNGIDSAAVYTALGGRPEPLPLGPHVDAWRPSTPNAGR